MLKPYALYINDVYQYLRDFEEVPVNIPHKKVVWYPVVYKEGPVGRGLEGDQYVIYNEPPVQE